MLRKITNDKDILVGDFYSGTSNGDSILFIFHGYFSSNRNGPAKLYDEIADNVIKLGITVAKFDCGGFGESKISFSEATYDTVLEDQHKVVEYILNEKSYKNVYFLGHSMGCSIAARLAERYTVVKKLFILAPAVSFPTFPLNLFSNSQWRELNEYGNTRRKGLLVNNQTIQKMFCKSNLEYFKRFPCKTVVILPEADQFYSLEDLNRVCSVLMRYQIFIIRNAEHNFIPRTSRSELFKCLSEALSLD